MVNRIRQCIPSTLATRLFLLTIVVEAAITVAIEAIILHLGDLFGSVFSFDSKQDGGESHNVLPVYLGLFCLAHVFQIVLAVDAIFQQNMIQIIGLCMFNFLFLIYSVVQINEVKTGFDEMSGHAASQHKIVPILLTVVPCVIGAAEFLFLVLSWKIYREFGWQVFKNLGADRKIKKMYMKYQIFICLCKFDIFFLFSFSMQFVLLVLNREDIEKWLTLAAAPVTLAVLAIGFMAARREIRWLMGVFMAFCAFGLAYFAFKLFRIFQNTSGRYTLVKKSLTVFSVLSIVLLLGTMIQAFLVFRNFGLGLKRHMSARNESTKADEAGYSGFPVDHLHYKLSSANSASSQFPVY